MSDEDHYPAPQRPQGAIPIGPSQGRQRGVQPDNEGPTRPPPIPTRTQRAQETRRKPAEPEYDPEGPEAIDNTGDYVDPEAARAAQHDRHFVGDDDDPIIGVLSILHAKRADLMKRVQRVEDAINTLSKLVDL